MECCELKWEVFARYIHILYNKKRPIFLFYRIILTGHAKRSNSGILLAEMVRMLRMGGVGVQITYIIHGINASDYD